MIDKKLSFCLDEINCHHMIVMIYDRAEAITLEVVVLNTETEAEREDDETIIS